MLINQFNGGLSTRLAPQMIGINEAVIYENIDNSLGTLTPVKGLTVAGLATKAYPYWFEAANRWIEGTNTYTPRVELNNKIYEVTELGLNVHSLLLTRPVGVARPIVTPVVTAVPSPPKPSKVTVAIGGGVGPTVPGSPVLGGLPAGAYTYLLLNKNEAGYSAGLSFTVDAAGKATVHDADYYMRAGEVITVKDYQVAVDTDTRSAYNLYFGPISCSIEAGYSADLYRMHRGVYNLIGTFESENLLLMDFDLETGTSYPLTASSFAPLKGEYQYVYTYINDEGIESVPSEVSEMVTLTVGGQASVAFAPPPVGCKVRIYRVGGNLTQFSLVEEVTGETGIYVDKLSDVNVDGRVLTSKQNYLPAPSMTAIITAYGMLFGAAGNNLRFTNPGEPEYWPEAYSVPFPTAITSCVAVANGILVFTATRTYLVTGSGPLALTVQLLSGDQGCISAISVQVYKGTALWASNDGICVSSGVDIEVLTKDKLGKIGFGTITGSAFYDECYYVTEGPNSLLVIDLRFGQATFKKLKLPVATITLFEDATTLYVADKATGTAYLPYSSATNLPMHYKSPRFIEGRASENKTYKKIYFYVEGVITLNVYINDVLVATTTTAPGTKDTITLQIPQEYQRGFFLQFELIGDGVVYEVEYVAGGRQDG